MRFDILVMKCPSGAQPIKTTSLVHYSYLKWATPFFRLFFGSLWRNNFLEHPDIVVNGLGFCISGSLVKPPFLPDLGLFVFLLHRSFSSCRLLITSTRTFVVLFSYPRTLGRRTLRGGAFSWPVNIMCSGGVFGAIVSAHHLRKVPIPSFHVL